ncbi:MAG TPA: CorA family divalent cation transporter, partial [Candidatus Polarisedimenticolaceae bacterium]|nr:CorA family divalent cation transporter [Candidatus Polarisedimenticolaceae bacterium]
MITTYYRNIKDPKLIQLDKFRTGSWLHLQAPTEEELAGVIEKFGLEAGHIRDALDPDEMPRLETEDDTTYVFMRYTYNNDGRLLTAPVALIVGPKALITIAPQPFPHLDLFTQGKLEVFTTQRAKLFLQLMRHITNTYNIGMNTIIRQI